MTQSKVAIICIGVAFGLHAFVMNVSNYRSAYNGSADKAIQAMLIMSFLLYGLAFLLSLFRGLGEEAGYVTSVAKPIVVAVLAGLGVVCFIIGMAVYGKYHGDYGMGIISYQVATYTMAAVFALSGCFVTVKDGISNGYSRES